MRCRIGDLAELIRSAHPENKGKIVHVVHYVGFFKAGLSVPNTHGWVHSVRDGHIWDILLDGSIRWAYDDDLKPLPPLADEPVQEMAASA